MTAAEADRKAGGQALADVISGVLPKGHTVRTLRALDLGTAYHAELWFAHGTPQEVRDEVAREVNVQIYLEQARRPWRLSIRPVRVLAKEMPA